MYVLLFFARKKIGELYFLGVDFPRKMRSEVSWASFFPDKIIKSVEDHFGLTSNLKLF